MTNKTQIRVANTADVNQLSKLELKAWIAQYVSEEYGVTEEEIEALDTSDRIRDWMHILRSENYRVWVALADQSNVVGFVAARKSEEEAELYGLWVLPSMDRKLASELGEIAIKWLSPNKRISTRVAVHDRDSLATYAKLGFDVNEHGPVDFILLKSGKRMPTVEMHKIQSVSNPRRKIMKLSKQAPVLVRRAELGKKSGVRISTIKHYTEMGLLPFSQEGERLSRRYDLEFSMKRLKIIAQLRSEGNSLEQIKKELLG
jgi:ribosomal protein S18 acetylase RimI-like enzyme